MSSDTEEMIRARGTPEFPPPYSGDTQLWAEDVDNYLRRRMQQLADDVTLLRARLLKMERANGIAGADRADDGAGAGDGEGEAVPRTRTELRRKHT